MFDSKILIKGKNMIACYFRAVILFTFICSIVPILSVVVSQGVLFGYRELSYILVLKIVSIFISAGVMVAMVFSKYILKKVKNIIIWRGSDDNVSVFVEEKYFLFFKSRTGLVITLTIWMSITLIIPNYIMKIGPEFSGIMFISLFGYFFWRNVIMLKIWSE